MKRAPRTTAALRAALLLAAALLAAGALQDARAHGGETHEAAPAAPQAPEPEATEAERALYARQLEIIASAEPEEHRRDLAAAWADTSGVFTELDMHASVAAGVGILSLMYALAVGPVRRRYGLAERVPWRQAGWFALSMLVLLGTLNGPIHHLSDYYLSSAHMLQHLLLSLLFPPIFLAGLPAWLLRPLLRVPGLGRAARVVTRPVIAYALFNACLVLWHVPVAYETALRHHDLHITQHLMFIALGVVAWWPVCGTLPELPRLPYLWQIGYLFVMQIPMVAIGAFLTLSGEVLYPFYAAAPRVVPGLSALADQQIGGLLMWLPGHIVLWIPMAYLFYRWYEAQTDTATGLEPAPSLRGVQ